MAPELEHLEKSGHFYHRGRDTTRLEAFVDAAFAFALTLLVISFDAVPQSFEALTTALKAVPAFLMAFCILAIFWLAHRKWSIRFGLDTTFSTVVSLALVFIILVYVFPLRAMAAAAMSAMTNGLLPTEFTARSIGEIRGLFIIYGIGFFACSFCIILLNRHAMSLADTLKLTPEERMLTRFEVMSWWFVGGFGVFSVVLAIVLPDPLVGLAGWSYMTMAIVMPLFGYITRKRFTEQFGGS